MKVAIGQFGAPTTVFNSSLYGVLEGFQGQAEVYGVIGGMSGLIAGRLAPLGGTSSFSWLLDTPGAALSAGRYETHEAAVEQALQTLIGAHVDAFVLIGGNGTMNLAAAIDAAARNAGYPLSVIGVPKTVDNDIVGIDHSAGFPSAARFVLQAVRDLQMDLEAMTGFEQVRVVEVMGRRCGWLAASAALLPHIAQRPGVGHDADGERVLAPIICLPERPLDLAALVQQIESRVVQSGNVLVVVSEGVLDLKGEPVLQSGTSVTSSASGILGGIGAVIAAEVRNVLGHGTRYENLGLLQRCWNDCSLQSDKVHARRLGNLGAKSLLAGQSGVMVGFQHSQADGGEQHDVHMGGFKKEEKYAFESGQMDGYTEVFVPLTELEGQERKMQGDALRMGDEFVQWLSPLVEIDTLTQYPRLESGQQTYRR